MTLDVICKMEVDEADALARGMVSEFGRQTYYFCSPYCKQRFDNQPNDYAKDPPLSLDEIPETSFHPFAG